MDGRVAYSQNWDRPGTVSVVTPCFNGGKYLPETFGSVVGQTWKDIEIIIVNDGSTDNSLDVATGLAMQHPEYAVKVIDQQNQGISKSRNNGIRAARGKYVMALDQDDIIRPGYIEEAVSLLERFPEAGLVTTFIEVFGENSRFPRQRPRDISELRKGNFIAPASLYRREAWERAGGYKPAVDGFEDWEFWVSIAEAGYKMKYVERPSFLWREHSANTSYKARRERFSLTYKIWCLHPGFFAPRATRVLGEDAARKCLRLRLLKEMLKARAVRILLPCYRVLKPWIAGTRKALQAG